MFPKPQSPKNPPLPSTEEVVVILWKNLNSFLQVRQTALLRILSRGLQLCAGGEGSEWRGGISRTGTLFWGREPRGNRSSPGSRGRRKSITWPPGSRWRKEAQVQLASSRVPSPSPSSRRQVSARPRASSSKPNRPPGPAGTWAGARAGPRSCRCPCSGKQRRCSLAYEP